MNCATFVRKNVKKIGNSCVIQKKNVPLHPKKYKFTRVMKKFCLCATSLSVLVLAVLMLTSAGNKQKRLFMVGDSTMADKTELEISPERGWGQLFPTYLSEDVIVENHAMNGRSTKSFRAEGRWDSVLVRAHRGDVVMIQFGHNDAKVEDSLRYASIADYERNLVYMCQSAEKKGLKVILCTSINRRSFSKETGAFYSKMGGYPEAVRRVAAQQKVPLLDLEKATAQWLSQLGDSASRAYFMNVVPGECTKFPNGKIDNTHLRENGALEVGRMAADMIVSQKIKCLAPYIRQGEGLEPQYTVFCRPNFKTDKRPVESDLKTDIK